MRQLPLAPGHGVAGDLHFAAARPVSVVVAKMCGEHLIGAGLQLARYGADPTHHVKASARPLFCLYESTVPQTRRTNRLGLGQRIRGVCACH